MKAEVKVQSSQKSKYARCVQNAQSQNPYIKYFICEVDPVPKKKLDTSLSATSSLHSASVTLD